MVGWLLTIPFLKNYDDKNYDVYSQKLKINLKRVIRIFKFF